MTLNGHAIAVLQEALECEQAALRRCRGRVEVAEAALRAEQAYIAIHDEAIMELNLTLERLREGVYA